jgi:hypothetical protein
MSSGITAEEFEKRFGFEAEQDDLHRVNCTMQGAPPGHLFCGVCDEHNKPRFICGCRATPKAQS